MSGSLLPAGASDNLLISGLSTAHRGCGPSRSSSHISSNSQLVILSATSLGTDGRLLPIYTLLLDYAGVGPINGSILVNVLTKKLDTAHCPWGVD